MHGLAGATLNGKTWQTLILLDNKRDNVLNNAMGLHSCKPTIRRLFAGMEWHFSCRNAKEGTHEGKHKAHQYR